MARKPAELVAAGGRTRGRQAIWEAIRRLRRFTVQELADAAKQESVRHYVLALERGGYLAGTVPAPRKAKVFELVRDTGVEAPRLSPDGSPCTQGRLREQMWRTMRMLDVFSPRELAFAASTEEHPVTEPGAQVYVHYLCQAGYLARIKMDAPGRPATYRFLASRFTGPRPPVIQQMRVVYDPNISQIVWAQDVDE